MNLRHETHTVNSLKGRAAAGERLDVPINIGNLSTRTALLASAVPTQIVAHDHIRGAESDARPNLLLVGNRTYTLSNAAVAHDRAVGRTIIKQGILGNVLANEYLTLTGLDQSTTLREAHLNTIRAAASGHNATTTSELLANSGEAGRVLADEVASSGLIKRYVQSNSRVWDVTSTRLDLRMMGVYGRNDETSADMGALLPASVIPSLLLLQAGSKGRDSVRILHDGTASHNALRNSLGLAEKVAAEIGGITIPNLIAIDYSGISELTHPAVQTTQLTQYDLLTIPRPDRLIPASAYDMPLSWVNEVAAI